MFQWFKSQRSRNSLGKSLGTLGTLPPNRGTKTYTHLLDSQLHPPGKAEERDHPTREPGGHGVPKGGHQPDVGDDQAGYPGEQQRDSAAEQGVQAWCAAAAGERAAQGRPEQAVPTAGDAGEHPRDHGQKEHRA